MSWYFIEPSDVLFFGDSRSFGAGDDHLAVSIFPPNPRTVAGAFRALVLGNSNVDWHDFISGKPSAESVREIIGSPEGILGSQFSMKGPFLAYRGASSYDLHMKLPYDAYFEDQEDIQFKSFSPMTQVPFITKWPVAEFRPLWPPKGERKDAPKESYWVGTDSTKKYTQGEQFTAKAESEILTYEPRIGIALDPKTRTTREKFLYQATFVRLEPSFGFIVWLNDAFDSLPENGYLILGGETKAARYERIQSDFEYDFGLKTPSKRFKVVLMTPAYFKSGWEPEGSDWSSLLGFPAKLISASLGKPLYLGGFDIVHNEERAIQTFVSPGSVYYFEADESIQELNVPFTESISQKMPLDRLGYGQAFLGHWDWQSLEEEK